jgi:hypothetical protein
VKHPTGLPDDILVVALALEVIPAVPPATNKSTQVTIYGGNKLPIKVGSPEKIVDLLIIGQQESGARRAVGGVSF